MIITSILFFLFGIVCHGELSGFIFNDNKSSRRYIHENGELSYEISNWPNKLGCCFSVFIDFNRYSSIIPLLDFRLNKYQSTRLSQGKLFKTFSLIYQFNQLMNWLKLIFSFNFLINWIKSSWLTDELIR